MTYSMLLSRGQDATGGDTSDPTTTFLQERMNDRLEEIRGKLKGYTAEATSTFSTVADQQYYHIPPGLINISSLEITIGSVKHPLTPIFGYDRWNKLNAVTIQATALPKHYFRRRDDFGIYPIPQDAYTTTLVYNYESVPIYRTDYTTGTVDTTQNSDQLTGNSSSWSGDVYAGQWFTLTDSNGKPRGNWYRIESVDGETTITLETVFEESSESTATYLIGDSPEIPKIGHKLIYQGAVSDYFAEKRQSPVKAQQWDNKYWTGSFRNTSRDPEEAAGGLLSLISDYTDRDDSQLVERRTNYDENDLDKQIFATTLSNSA